MSHRFQSGTILAVLLLLLVGCAPSAPHPSDSSNAPAGAPAGGSAPSTRPLHIGNAAEPSVIGSKFGGGGSGAVDFPFIFHAQLTHFDPSGVPLPVLVQEIPSVERGTWRVFDDGRMETTYKLRPSLSWHDGTPFTAADVVFTWRATMLPSLPAEDRMPEKLITSINTPDPQTFVIQWEQPYIFANALALQPIPRHILEPLIGDPSQFAKSTYWTTDWVGLGPYRLTEWVQGTQVKGEAFAGYALGMPKIQTIVIHIISDANQAVAQMLAGAIDVTTSSLIRPDEGVIVKQQLEPRGEGTIVTFPNKMRHGVFQFRDPNAPWVRDLRVRQAMMHGIDRQVMADALMQGYSQVSDMYIAPADPAFPRADRAVKKYPYDPTRAQQLLREAGWEPGSDGIMRNTAGTKLDFEVRTTPEVQGTKEAQLLADQWKRVGLDTNVFLIPRTEQRNQEYRAKFPGMTTTSIASLEAFYYTSDTVPHEGNNWQGTNRGGYTSPEGDRLDHLYFTTIDPAKRQDVLINILTYVSEQLPYLAFYYNVDTHAVRSGLKGIGSRWDRQPGITFNISDWTWAS